LLEIQPRHWQALAERAGGSALWERMQSFVDAAPRTFERIKLPRGFPESVISPITEGVHGQARKFFNALTH